MRRLRQFWKDVRIEVALHREMRLIAGHGHCRCGEKLFAGVCPDHGRVR